MTGATYGTTSLRRLDMAAARGLPGAETEAARRRRVIEQALDDEGVPSESRPARALVIDAAICATARGES